MSKRSGSAVPLNDWDGLPSVLRPVIGSRLNRRPTLSFASWDRRSDIPRRPQPDSNAVRAPALVVVGNDAGPDHNLPVDPNRRHRDPPFVNRQRRRRDCAQVVRQVCVRIRRTDQPSAGTALSRHDEALYIGRRRLGLAPGLPLGLGLTVTHSVGQRFGPWSRPPYVTPEAIRKAFLPAWTIETQQTALGRKGSHGSVQGDGDVASGLSPSAAWIAGCPHSATSAREAFQNSLAKWAGSRASAAAA
jgi:hypothetical protein